MPLVSICGFSNSVSSDALGCLEQKIVEDACTIPELRLKPEEIQITFEPSLLQEGLNTKIFTEVKGLPRCLVDDELARQQLAVVITRAFWGYMQPINVRSIQFVSTLVNPAFGDVRPGYSFWTTPPSTIQDFRRLVTALLRLNVDDLLSGAAPADSAIFMDELEVMSYWACGLGSNEAAQKILLKATEWVQNNPPTQSERVRYAKICREMLTPA